MEPRASRRKLVVPVVLAVSLVATAVTATSVIVSGCGSDKPRTDAGVTDGRPDTPIV